MRYFAGYSETLVSFPYTAHPDKNHTRKELFSLSDKTEHSYHVAYLLFWVEKLKVVYTT